MSRGGRGAFRGGGRIGGVEVPWEFDPDIKPDYRPSELFPVVVQPKPTPLSRTERLQVARYRAFRDRVHEGPLYTILGDNHRVGKQGGSTRAALVDPFEGMPTYSQKYQKKTRRLPRLDTRPYVMDFFPTELWSTLDPDYEKQHNEHEMATSSRAKKKILKLSRPDLNRDLLLNNEDDEAIDDDDVEVAAEQKQRSLSTQEALNNLKEDEDEPEKPVNDELGEGEADEEELDEEEQDDDFEDAEDEMGADYNAEGYFEDGRDDDMEDFGDMGGGGDGDGGDYF